MPLWIFFGKSGAGKSFVGRVCVEEFGFELYDGDSDLTPAMLGALREHRVFTAEMRAEFGGVLSRGIRERCVVVARGQRASSRLAVCQGLFKICVREKLQLDFPHAQFIWVRAPEAQIERHLRRRAGHVASTAYAQLVNQGFEPPAPGGEVLENDGDRSRVVAQLRAYLESSLADGVAPEP